MIKESVYEKKGILSHFPAMAVFSLIGMIITLLTAFLLAILISKGVIPESARNITALCCVPGTFVTGLLTARRSGKRILPMGLASGGMFLILLLLISIIFLPKLDTWGGFWWVLMACAGGSAAGALCALGMRR